MMISDDQNDIYKIVKVPFVNIFILKISDNK